MPTPELPQEDQPRFANVTDLLGDVSARYNALGVEARRRLHEDRNPDGRMAALRERATLIVDLPATLAAYEASGGEVPPEAERFAANYAQLATEVLEEDNTFGMGTILMPPGSAMSDPSDLERLIARLQQPPTEAP